MIIDAMSIHANTGQRIEKSASDAMAGPRRRAATGFPAGGVAFILTALGFF
jgi:hypothetical protein